MSPDSRLDELFVRYWDNVLTTAEVDELAQRLASDSAAREQFQFLCLLAVASADLTAGAPGPDLPFDLKRTDSAGTSRRWSRRRALGLLASGLAAGVGGLLLGWWAWDTLPVKRVRVIAVQGRVTVRTAEGRTVAAEGRVPIGATVATHGFGAIAVLSYPDGSTISLLEDCAITVEDGGQLRLHQGTATADLRRGPDGEGQLTLVTALITLARASDTTITIGQGRRSTEVEVHQGKARVTTASGEPLAVVRRGELLTVAANGTHRQEPTPLPQSDFAWNLAAPLPEGWQVGRRELTPAGPVVRSTAWADPYYDGTRMFQIRSDHQWARGLFSLALDSVISVRYRAREPSPKGQVCVCVRTPHSHCSDTGMLEYNGGFDATAPGEWKWLRVRAGDMLANKHTPRFGSPWIGFLLIFNTFQTDVGFEVAEFRVSSPGQHPA